MAGLQIQEETEAFVFLLPAWASELLTPFQIH